MLPPKFSGFLTVEGSKDCMFTRYSNHVSQAQYSQTAVNDNSYSNQSYAVGRQQCSKNSFISLHTGTQLNNSSNANSKYGTEPLFDTDQIQNRNIYVCENTKESVGLGKVVTNNCCEFENELENGSKEYRDGYYNDRRQRYLDDAEGGEEDMLMDDESSESGSLEEPDGCTDHVMGILSRDEKEVKAMECQKVKSSYKHIPHKDKPPHLVAKRNARERKRVQAVNSAFGKLRKHIPYPNKNKRLSKVKTLKIAIDYIHQLQDLIEDHDHQTSVSVLGRGGLEPGAFSLNAHHQYGKNWPQPSDQQYSSFDGSFSYCSGV